MIRELQGTKLTFSKISARKKWLLLRVKIRQKWAIIPFFNMFEILGEAGSKKLLQQMFRKFWIVFPTDIFRKLTLGAPKSPNALLNNYTFYSYLTLTSDKAMLLTQWVAVKTHWGWIKDPPQNCLPLLDSSIACQGQPFTGASDPFTIRGVLTLGLTPHVTVMTIQLLV